MSHLGYDGDGSRQRIALRMAAGQLRNVAGSIESVATANLLGIIDWEQLREDVDGLFAHIFEVLEVVGEDTEELDIMEGEEADFDDTLHPLDPDNEFYEGFDDVC